MTLLKFDSREVVIIDLLFFVNLGKIHSASVVLNIPDLEKVAAKRKRAVRRLEKR